MVEVRSEVHGIRARGGVHVPAARLWLDGEASHGLRFLAELDERSRGSRRRVCSAPLAELLPSTATRPLAVPYARPFQLGRIAVELLPAGSSPGSAMLRAHLDGRAVLFAGPARLDAAPTAEPIAWREADILVLDATLAERELPGPVGLVPEVDAAVAHAAVFGQLDWVFDTATVALDALTLVAGRVPVTLSTRLARLAGRYIAAGRRLPAARNHTKHNVNAGLTLRMQSDVAAAMPLLGDRWLAAEDAGPQALAAVGASRGFAVSRRAAGTDLDGLALASGATLVVATGAGAAALCARLQQRGVRCVHLLADGQLPLM